MNGGDQKPSKERRSLAEGLGPRPDVVRAVEERFVKGDKALTESTSVGDHAPVTTHHPQPSPTVVIGRTPLSTRIRADYAAALKRASLERQLSGIAPNTLQDILEEALGPWLAANGYVTLPPK